MLLWNPALIRFVGASYKQRLFSDLSTVLLRFPGFSLLLSMRCAPGYEIAQPMAAYQALMPTGPGASMLTHFGGDWDWFGSLIFQGKDEYFSQVFRQYP